MTPSADHLIGYARGTVSTFANRRLSVPVVMLFAAEGGRAMLVELSHEHRAS